MKNFLSKTTENEHLRNTLRLEISSHDDNFSSLMFFSNNWELQRRTKIFTTHTASLRNFSYCYEKNLALCMCDVVKSCKGSSFTWNTVTQTFSQTGDNDSCVSSRQIPSTEKCEGEKLLQMINIYKCAYVMFALFVVLRRFSDAYIIIQKK